ncbi:HesA/MoeB/ThiF family protein [Falsirhodobacter halotolerans]|uniref:HesA/MoeB/ThiF family protein n=1 Tax=Falsirhodobacter halotolerans TaxID=1146892 RepID=UPI003140BB65
MLSEAELHRYSRHMLLREVGGVGQMRLGRARVLVIGAGGLGAGALPYLAAAGIGHITVMDGDEVEVHNLQRQVVHDTAHIGMNKALSAAARMRAINPHVVVEAMPRHLTDEPDLVAAHDLILDGTDSFATRYLANDLAVRVSRPLISGALTQWEGQIGLYADAGSACLRCVFPEIPAEGLVPSCAEAGVLGPLPGIIGGMMAAEAVKRLAGAGTPLRNRLMIFDALYMETRVMTVHRRDDCPTCGNPAHR